MILRVQIKKNPWQKLSKSAKNKKETSSDEDDKPLMELSKGMQEKDRANKLGNGDTSAENKKSVNEVSSFNEHAKELQVKTLL